MRVMVIQLSAFVLSLGLLACSTVSSSAPVADLKTTAPAQPPTAAKGTRTAVFAGGCFWGVEAVFEHVKGVTDARSGYAGGSARTAEYDQVSDGNTGHAEAVQVTFDPEKVSYAQLLEIFFSVAHDPTQLNFQGPDHGTQYRSAIFYTSEEQKKQAADYIASLESAKKFTAPIVTEVASLKQFFEAEAYHQDYLKHHPDERYIIVNDKPKVEALKNQFPDLWRDSSITRK
jgi:peptide-methionine (S)-S-oxide reductase